MSTVAFLVDILLYLVFVLSISLSFFKIIDLWTNSLNEFSFGSTAKDFLTFKERGLTWLSIIASVGPFVGLAGTVMHIVVALQKIGDSADMSVISGPIATALTSTLIGLCAAIPALVVYNLAQRKLYLIELELSADNEEGGTDE